VSAAPPRRGAALAVTAALAIGGAFSFYQLGSWLFSCGRLVSGPEIHLWAGFSALQGVAFLMGSISPRWRNGYRLLQYATLPLVAAPLLQLAFVYPATFAGLALLGIAYRYGIARRGPGAGVAGQPLVESMAFVLATVVVHSAIAFVVLNTRGLPLGDALFAAILVASAVVAAWIVRGNAPHAPLTLAEVPPLALLAVVLLRAKLPDQAYDTLFYKATVPITIADWRTAVTGALDAAALLGTDFQEFINAQLRISDPGYSPALVSTLAFVGLWIVAPAAAGSVMPRAYGPLARNVLALLLVSLTEALVAAGTTYQEPLMGLLMAAALLPMPAAWVFLAAGVAVKVTVIFVVPVIVLAKGWPMGALAGGPGWGKRVLAEVIDRARARRLALAACLLLAALAAGEQFYRNVAYTGRLTAITEILAGLTDPDGRVLARETDNPLQAQSPHGAWEKYGRTFVHVLTLDRWIVPTQYTFHAIPSSRLAAIAAMLVLLVFGLPALRRDRVLVMSFLVWLACMFSTLTFVWQGRYLYALSFASALVVALAAGRVGVQGGNRTRVAVAVAAAFLAAGDQVLGSYINDGWVCRRNLLTGVVPNSFEDPVTPLERRLDGIVAQYRARSPWRDVAPTVLCEETVDRLHYIGTHYIYTRVSLDINRRRLAARPDLAASIPTSLLAICYTAPDFPDQILAPAARAQYEALEPVAAGQPHPVYILVSRPLMAGARPTTLAGPLAELANAGARP
jgi:hypothetical protein